METPNAKATISAVGMIPAVDELEAKWPLYSKYRSALRNSMNTFAMQALRIQGLQGPPPLPFPIPISPPNYKFDELEFQGRETVIVDGLCRACGRFNWRRLFARFFDDDRDSHLNRPDILDGFRGYKPARDNLIEFGHSWPSDSNKAFPLAPLAWALANRDICSLCGLIAEAARLEPHCMETLADQYILTFYLARGGVFSEEDILFVKCTGIQFQEPVFVMQFALHDDGVSPLRFLRMNKSIEGGEECQMNWVTHCSSKSQIDISMVKHWIFDCSRNHSECRIRPKNSPKQRPAFRFRVIDVQNDEVVRPFTAVKYVALSYAWGGDGNNYKASTKDFICCPRRHDCVSNGRPVFPLDRGKLPQTIQDAMQLVEAVGERYLWVDALCIAQDNKKEWMPTLKSMDKIYEEAAFTIIAASGTNADAGLQGVRPASRNFNSITGVLDGIPLIQGKKILDLGCTPWAKRGWTFQETILSRKRLIFANDRVFYRCCFTMRGEDRPLDFLGNDYHVSKNITWGRVLDTMDLWDDYSGKVQEYTARTLTIESDVYAAFAGIEARYVDATGSKFYCGLPTITNVIFSLSLLWGLSPLSDCRSLRLRKIPEDDSSEEHFPSYSWASWIGGQIDMNKLTLGINFATTRSLIEWPWNKPHLAKAEKLAVEKGVLKFSAQVSLLTPDKLLANIVEMDDGKIWETGAKTCILVAESYSDSLRFPEFVFLSHWASPQDMVYFLIIKEERDGMFVREGICSMPTKSLSGILITRRMIQLR